MREIIRQFADDISTADRKAVFALIYAAFGLSCIFYLKEKNGFLLPYAAEDNLPLLAYWAILTLIFYVAVPAFAIKFIFRERLADHGLRLVVENGFWKIYGLSVAIMLPIVYLMANTAGFLAKYPFYQRFDNAPYLSTSFAIWEMLYFLQFFGLEFFFRGFLVHSLKPKLGIYSIFVMTVPYCMIHFGKPMPETLAAIFAGIFLGWISYRNGSIWLGLLLHCTVAAAMDVMALYNKGLL